MTIKRPVSPNKFKNTGCFIDPDHKFLFVNIHISLGLSKVSDISLGLSLRNYVFNNVHVVKRIVDLYLEDVKLYNEVIDGRNKL